VIRAVICYLLSAIGYLIGYPLSAICYLIRDLRPICDLPSAIWPSL